MLAGAAWAGLPNAANSTLGTVFVADFTNSAPAAPQDGQINAIVVSTCIRDADNNPVPFVTCTVDFSTCGTNVEMAANQEDPNVTTNCALETATVTADAGGCVQLGPFLARTLVNVSGWPDAPGNTPTRNIGPATQISCAAVYAGGFLMGTAEVHINRYDSDQDGDVDAGDRGFTLDAEGQFFGGPPPTPPYRIFYDYDYDNDVDAGDRGLVLQAEGLYFGGFRVPYPGPWCP
jgi:hypothetical protein